MIGLKRVFCRMLITLHVLIELTQKTFDQSLRDVHYSLLVSYRLLCICCADMMNIFVSYINRGVDVPRAYR